MNLKQALELHQTLKKLVTDGDGLCIIPEEQRGAVEVLSDSDVQFLDDLLVAYILQHKDDQV